MDITVPAGRARPNNHWPSQPWFLESDYQTHFYTDPSTYTAVVSTVLLGHQKRHLPSTLRVAKWALTRAQHHHRPHACLVQRVVRDGDDRMMVCSSRHVTSKWRNSLPAAVIYAPELNQQLLSCQSLIGSCHSECSLQCKHPYTSGPLGPVLDCVGIISNSPITSGQRL